jgi:hypothetical protein
VAEKTITMTEAFRVVLRAGYPQRPALADEIRDIHYFHQPFDKTTGRRIDPEVQAADDALAVLKEAVNKQSIRLRAWLGDNPPADIEPMEVAWNGVHVFDGTIEVYGERGRTLRTYRNVHCYAAEIAAIVAGATPCVSAAPRKRGPKLAAAQDAIKACYPEKVPDVAEVPNGPFCTEIFRWLKTNRPAVRMDNKTVLRAAGRAD